MKKFTFILLIAVLLAGGAVVAMTGPSQAQGYGYPPPPSDPYASPWVGPSTPWVYYNGDWFLNGLLYYFFGPQYGWAPYYAYPPTYIVRPGTWYAPRWLTWYRGHPDYYQHFQQSYPYWREHRQGRRYDEKFFEQHQHGQAGEWQKGFHGHPSAPTHPGGQQPGPGPGRVAPPAGQRPTGPTHVTPATGQRPERPTGPTHVAPPAGQAPAGPTHVTPAPGQRPERPTGPAHVAPPEGRGPAPTHVAPPAGPQPGPAHVAPPAGPRPAPAPAPKAAPAPPAKAAPGAPQPERGGEEKH